MTRPWDPDGAAEDWNPGGDAELATQARRKDRWRIFGIVLAVVVAIAGVALVAALLLFVTAMNSYGSNK